MLHDIVSLLDACVASVFVSFHIHMKFTYFLVFEIQDKWGHCVCFQLEYCQWLKDGKRDTFLKQLFMRIFIIDCMRRECDSPAIGIEIACARNREKTQFFIHIHSKWLCASGNERQKTLRIIRNKKFDNIKNHCNGT